jgi:hypothetical protein
MDATNASSGSIFAGFEYGKGTAAGEDEAGTVRPPSNDHVCARGNLPFRNSSPVLVHRIVALCSDILVPPRNPAVYMTLSLQLGLNAG